ncbi:MAG TPA: BON domain-containing protein [bacterium]|nr:BON domain-containing protein [bacterium]
MRSDSQVKQDVEEELKWEPVLHPEAIRVAVKDGKVTLTGYVDSYAERLSAEDAARKLWDVKGVVDEIEVRLHPSYERADAEIVRAVENALAWNIRVPTDRIKVTAEHGWVTLKGQVDWHFQRLAAWETVRHMSGVRGVSNEITIRPSVTPAEVKAKIEAAHQRNAILDAKRIKVTTSGGKVTLTGTVRSWRELQEAEDGAWAAPGVTEVQNLLVVTGF